MKFSKLFAPSLKEAPRDAVLPSHALLIRAGFIEQLGSGLYNFLPLGKIVRRHQAGDGRCGRAGGLF